MITKKTINELDELAKRFIIGENGYTESQKELIIIRARLEDELTRLDDKKRRINNLIDSINNKLALRE